MSHTRKERVAEQIKQEIGNLLVRDVKDPDLNMVTITKAQMSPDLRYAKIYYSVMKDKELAAAALERAGAFLRVEIGKRIKLRYVPELQFIYDDSGEYADHIESLLRKIHEEK